MDRNSANWDHCLDVAAVSDIGMRRANNQDSMAVAMASDQDAWQHRGHLFLVADGMGAHAAGEMASKLAADNIPLSYHKYGDLPAPEALRKAIQDANDLIHRRGQSSEDFRGMGTTCTTLALLPEGAAVGQVGDSRTYRLRGNLLEQLTFDHSLVWEMRASGQLPAEQVLNYVPKNIITRSLGPNPEVQVDLEGPFPLLIGDTFLLCSDGLSGQIRDKEMGAILAALPPKKAIRALVDLANLRGGPDNITIIIARVTGPLVSKVVSAGAPRPAPAAAAPKPGNPLLWTAFGMLLLASLAMFGMGYWKVGLGSLLAALIVALVAMIQRYTAGADEPKTTSGNTMLGRAPYTQTDCTPDAEVVGWLSEVAVQLREAARNGNWSVNWPTFNATLARAEAARTAANHLQAVREYCEAVMFMMDQLRHQNRRAPGDDRVNL